MFINGLLEGTGGTCSSMPVLYIAIGRRLGFPLKLVSIPEHSFLRWDDPVTGEKFNIDGTTRGYGSYSDEYYSEWPRAMHPIERERGNFLESMTPREELSTFLATRGDHLYFSGRLEDANHAYQAAAKLGPRNYGANLHLGQTTRLLNALRREAEVEAAWQRWDRERRTNQRLIIPGIPQPVSPTPGNFGAGRGGRGAPRTATQGARP